MIPLLLEARNFMAYEHLALDFTPFQIACLSGPNGSGKSSILDAMTWALFEKSRATQSEEVIRLGAQEVQVQFSFELAGQTYRILRSKQRGTGKSSGKAVLEFQVKAEGGYRSLTGKSVTKTQQEIINTLHMDYGLFIHSSFILQGRADVFTTSSAKERKEVLADILNLKQYDLLQERAKAKRNQFLLDKQQLQGQISQIESQLSSELFLKDQHLSLKEEYQTLSERLRQEQRILSELESEKQQLNQQCLLLKQNQTRLAQVESELQKKRTDKQNLSHDKTKIQKLLEQQETIAQGYQHLQLLLEKQDDLELRYADYLKRQETLRTAQNQWIQLQYAKEKELQHAQSQLESLRKEEQQYQRLLADAETIEKDWQELQTCQTALLVLEEKARSFREWEKTLWAQTQRLQSMQAEKNAEIIRLKTQISEDQQELEQAQKVSLNLVQLEADLADLDRAQADLEQITAQGQSSKHLGLTLAEKKEEHQARQLEIAAKTHNLMGHVSDNCPLCERLLSPEDVALLVKKYQLEHEKVSQALAQIETEITENERVASHCRQEFVRLTRELKRRESLMQKWAQAKHECERVSVLKIQIQEKLQALHLAENWREAQDWRVAQAAEQELQQRLKQLNYSEAAHSQTQKELNTLQTAALRHHELLKAREALLGISPQLAEAERNYQACQTAFKTQAFGQDIRQAIAEQEAYLNPLAHLPESLNQNRAELVRLRVYQQKWEALKAGQETWEQLLNQGARLERDLTELQGEAQQLHLALAELPSLTHRLEQNSAILTPLLVSIGQTQNRERELHARLFSLEKELQSLAEQKVDLLAYQSQFQQLENEHRLYAELVEIFGQKGIQAVVIENALPEIEQAANDLLSQMTEGRMHLKFQTLKSLKSRDALSETLDIFISDELGTRSYETFSAGEAFRVNFAIRLAISRTLARRAGAKLQTLVIDEGFGSQDTQGKSRLVEAINAVSNLYACILVITHVDDLKSLFPTRIEVQKYPEGARIQLLQ